MSKNGHRERISIEMRNVCQWHRNKAIAAWNAGKWPLYRKHIRIADAITRKG